MENVLYCGTNIEKFGTDNILEVPYVKFAYV